MSELKCPFCQDYLIPCIQNQNDWLYHCDNQKCPIYDDADNENAKHLLASEDLWQEIQRTRKALDVALDWLGQVATPEKCDDDLCREFTKRKLAEIKTALEQKDVK
ncbi:MAG: hypothetical protein ACLRFP_01340 [Alphaproteobacteria bacterium]